MCIRDSYNLAEKPAGPDENLLNTMYAADTVTLSHSISYGDGLTNFVKPDTFVDDALFSQSASVLIGQPYIFRMSLISGSKQISNAILFNNFGKASVDGKQSTWTGTFESIDLSNATIRGIAPVVYYTTEENAPYFTADDTRMRAVPAAWTTVKPSNPADIKGLAVDLSHATDGSEYAIPLQQAIGVYVTMRAPSTLPSPDTEAVSYTHLDVYKRQLQDVHRHERQREGKQLPEQRPLGEGNSRCRRSHRFTSEDRDAETEAARTAPGPRMKKRRGRSHPRRSRFPASRHRRQGMPLGGAPPDADDYVRPCSVRCFIGDHAQSGSPAKYHWFPQRDGCNAGQHTAPHPARQPREHSPLMQSAVVRSKAYS